jgi:hypothetical protein
MHTVSNSVQRQLQLARDRLDLPALDEVRPPISANRVFSAPPRPDLCTTHPPQVICTNGGGVKIARRFAFLH